MLLRNFCTALVLLITGPSLAHEFWLDPEDFTLETGQELNVDIRVGQNFSGNAYSFNPQSHFDFSITDSAGKHPIDGRLGDRPSVQLVPENSGLLVLNHFSISQRVTYDEAGKFESFIASKGLDWVLEQHRARGLPDTGFSEGYTRFAKSLVAVDGGAGQDSLTGMPFELLALANPYTDDISNGLPVQLFYNGVPMPNIQIDIFNRTEGGITKTHVNTDANGRAIIPVQNGVYLINAVHMILPTSEEIQRTSAVWHSLWASMTFEIE